MSLQGYTPGKVAQLQMSAQIPPDPAIAWGNFADIYSLGNLNLLRAAYDSTNHGDSFYRHNMKGVYDKIVVSVSINYIVGEYLNFSDLVREDPGERWWRIDINNYAMTFMASVAKVEPLTPRDERITFDVELVVSGVVAFGLE